MAKRRVPKFTLNNCAQSSKKTFICPKFYTNPVLKHTKCHISTNLSNFLKLCLLYCQKLFALAPTNHRFAEKNRLSGNTAAQFKEPFTEKQQLVPLVAFKSPGLEFSQSFSIIKIQPFF